MTQLPASHDNSELNPSVTSHDLNLSIFKLLITTKLRDPIFKIHPMTLHQ